VTDPGSDAPDGTEAVGASASDSALPPPPPPPPAAQPQGVNIAPGWYLVDRQTNVQGYWDGTQWSRTRRWRGSGWVEDPAPVAAAVGAATAPGAQADPAGAPPYTAPAPRSRFLPPGTSPPSQFGYDPMRANRPPIAPSTSGFAIASLVLSIVCLFGIGSLLAIIFGFRARREIRVSRGYLTGDGLAVAGIVIGFVTGAIALVVVPLWFITLFTLSSDIRNGVNSSGTPQAAIANCQSDVRTVEVALQAYKASPTNTSGSFPAPPAPWSATTYFTNYGVLTGGTGPTLHNAPSTNEYVVEFDASGDVWVAPPNTFESTYVPQQGFDTNPNACADAVG
jgi:uncharacterized protein DUF4190